MPQLPFGQPGAVITIALPEDVSEHDLRLTLVGDPSVAFASLRGQRYTTPPYTGLSDEILNWLGRPGTSPGRKYGERHFLRIVPFLRDGWTHTAWRPGLHPGRGITDVIVARPEHLRADGLLALIDAVAAADACLWLLHGARMAADTHSVMAAHGEPADWATLWQQWADRRHRQRPDCTAVAAGWWRAAAADPSFVLGSGDHEGEWSPCPSHANWLGCLRASLAHAVGTIELHETDARQIVLGALRRDGGRRWQYHELARDTFAPAREAVEDLCRSLQLPTDLALDVTVGALSIDADMIALGDDAYVVPHDIRAPLRRQRALTLLAGGTHDSPLLTIWGVSARMWGTRPREHRPATRRPPRT